MLRAMQCVAVLQGLPALGATAYATLAAKLLRHAGSNVVSVAEHVVMQILALVRNYIPAYKQARGRREAGRRSTVCATLAVVQALPRCLFVQSSRAVRPQRAQRAPLAGGQGRVGRGTHCRRRL